MNKELTIQEKLSPIETKVTELVIDSPKSMEEGAELLSQVNRYADAAKTEKDKVMRPILDAAAAERKRWKPVEDTVKPLIETLRKKMSAYQTAEKNKSDDEKAKIAARVGEGKGHLKITTAAKKQAEVDTPEEKVVADSGSVAFKTDYEVVVDDVHKIPAEYLEVKTGAIKMAHKKGVVVPGVTVNEVQVPVNRR